MSEIPQVPIRLLHKDVIKRELSPIYTCTTIKLLDSEIGRVYRRAMDEILGKNRATEYSYLDGMSIKGQDLKRGEKVRVLKQLAKHFRERKVAFSSCYVDILGADKVNLGLYFDGEDELNNLVAVFKDDVKFSFIADLQSDGSYTVRGEEGGLSGHFTNEPHLKGDFILTKEN